MKRKVFIHFLHIFNKLSYDLTDNFMASIYSVEDTLIHMYIPSNTQMLPINSYTAKHTSPPIYKEGQKDEMTFIVNNCQSWNLKAGLTDSRLLLCQTVILPLCLGWGLQTKNE